MDTSPARRESFNIAGSRISGVVAGNPNNPAVLLLHGFPSSSRGFRNIIPRMSQSCFAIAPDLPGFGQSDLIADPTFTRFADLIEGVLEKLGVVSAYLYLHDFGAPVALELAMRDPRRVLGLIIQNANDLPRMEAHVLDGPHLLLETHAAHCAELIVDFVRRGKPSS